MQLLPTFLTTRSSEPYYVLSFLSGSCEGKNLSLRREHEILIGRNKGLDIVLEDTLVSRQHAKIITSCGTVSIKDLESRNGTYVNGERITKARLSEGDRVRIGSSIIMLTAIREPAAGEQRVNGLDLRQRSTTGWPSPESGAAVDRSMVGQLGTVSLVDLLQLLATIGKSGVVTIRSNNSIGRIYMREGRVYYAAIDGKPEFSPKKAIYRLLARNSGTFELEPADSRRFERELIHSTTGLLMEASQYLDEIRQLKSELPKTNASVLAPKVPPGNFDDLTAEEKDVYNLAVKHGTLDAVLDHHPGTDLEVCRIFASLLASKFLVVP